MTEEQQKKAKKESDSELAKIINLSKSFNRERGFKGFKTDVEPSSSWTGIYSIGGVFSTLLNYKINVIVINYSY